VIRVATIDPHGLRRILTVVDLLLDATREPTLAPTLLQPLLPALLRAIPADSVVCGVTDSGLRELFTEPVGLLEHAELEEFERHARDDPLVAHTRSGLGVPVRRSDLQDRRGYRALGTYTHVYRAIGADHQLAMSLPAGAGRLACFAFNRSDSDFNEDDVTVAAALRPRLATVMTQLVPARPQSVLTPREAQILELLSAGDNNHRIAHRLGISPRTVDKHLEHAYTKLDAHGLGRVAVARRWLATCGGSPRDLV
jgi:DNA-binding CsgD family transcriptional regulator